MLKKTAQKINEETISLCNNIRIGGLSQLGCMSIDSDHNEVGGDDNDAGRERIRSIDRYSGRGSVQ